MWRGCALSPGLFNYAIVPVLVRPLHEFDHVVVGWVSITEFDYTNDMATSSNSYSGMYNALKLIQSYSRQDESVGHFRALWKYTGDVDRLYTVNSRNYLNSTLLSRGQGTREIDHCNSQAWSAFVPSSRSANLATKCGILHSVVHTILKLDRCVRWNYICPCKILRWISASHKKL